MRALDRWRHRQERTGGIRGAQPGRRSDDTATDPTATDPTGTDPAGWRVAHLATTHDTVLAVKGSRLDQTRRAPGRARLLWEPGDDLGLLVGDDLNHEFGLGPSGPRAVAHLVRLAWTSETTVAVADLWDRTWLSPAPVDDVEPGAPRLRAGVTDAGPEEALTLRPTGTADADPELAVVVEVAAHARRLHRGAGVRAADVVRALTDPDLSRARTLFSTLLPLSPREELVRAARELLAREDLVAVLEGLFPDDPWATRSLPSLHAWLRDRDMRWRTQEVGTDLDVLWRAGPGDVAASSSEALTFAARGTVEPRRRVCVVATARNEGVYLLEWLAYYRALGVDEIFLYSNNNDDGSDVLLRTLADAGVIRWLDSAVGTGTKAQAKAYAHAYSVLPEVLDFTWSMTIDVDEFLVLDPARFDSLADFLDWHSTRQTDVVAVNWVVVGPEGRTRWEDGPVTRRFGAAVAPVDAHIKSISRPGRVLGSQPHFPYTAERERLAFREATTAPHTWFTSELAPHIVQAQSDRPTTGHAALHHYALKSAEEFLWKFSRNRGGRITATADDGLALTLEERFVKRFLGQFDRDTGDVRPAIDATVPDLERGIAELRGLDGVAAAEDQVRELTRARSARVVDAYRPVLRDHLGESGRRLLRLIEAADQHAVHDPHHDRADDDVDGEGDRA